MTLFTILRDNREQKPWEFEGYMVDVRDVTMETGDYTIAELCDHDDEKDTYYPQYAVERKSGQDFIQSITHSRERFEEEIKRAGDWDDPMVVLIEEPERTFRRQRKFMKYRKTKPSQIFGTVDSWEKHYNVEFVFAGSRQRAQQRAFDELFSKFRLLNSTISE